MNHGLESRIEVLEQNQIKIRAILNIIVNSMSNATEVRQHIEDDQSSAGFLE